MPDGASRKPTVLIVDDHLDMAESVADGLVEVGFDARAVSDPREALTAIEDEGDALDALVTDLRMPTTDGLTLLDASLKAAADRPVVLMTAYGAIDTAIAAIRRGAYHYLTKPFKVEELALVLRRALDHRAALREARSLRSQLGARRVLSEIVGESAAMRSALETMMRVADTDAPVLILGETGTGKSMFARTIHRHSSRRSASFVAVNCASIPEQLLESELFGHVRGAFTGATGARAGLFVEANGGTLFLDEVGDLALPLQAKLLHALERGTVRPVGGSREVPVDVRLISATHRDLREMVDRGQFRADLLYRLEVVSFAMPPLRGRAEDLPILVSHFFARMRERHPKSPAERLLPATLAALLAHDWPGNVRELAHVIERLVVLAKGPDVGPDELPPTFHRSETVPVPTTNAAVFSVREVLELREVQRRYARWSFAQLGEHRGRTAERLGIDYKTLARLLREEEVDEPGSA
jgi:two-component system response regulator HydG